MAFVLHDVGKRPIRKGNYFPLHKGERRKQQMEIETTPQHDKFWTDIKCPKHGYADGFYSIERFDAWICPGCIAEEYIDIVESPCGFIE